MYELIYLYLYKTLNVTFEAKKINFANQLKMPQKGKLFCNTSELPQMNQKF